MTYKTAPELHRERIKELETELERLQSKLNHERGQLAFKTSDKLVRGSDEGDTQQFCECGAEITTEKLFWAHFVIPDRRYLNLGNCPNKYDLSSLVNLPTEV